MWTCCVTLNSAMYNLNLTLNYFTVFIRLAVDELTKDRDDAVAKLDQLKAVVGVECGPCIFLRQELEAKHTKEMEELRCYFEQKCADVEKK